MGYTELGIFVVLSLFALLGLLGVVQAISKRHPKWKRFFPGLVVVCLLAVVAVDFTVIRSVQTVRRTRYETSEYKEHMDLCDNLVRNSSVTYTDDQSARPILIISLRDDFGYRARSPLNDSLPPHWQPESPSDIQLVLCIDRSGHDTIQSCEYFGAGPPSGSTTSDWVIRKQHVLSVRLVDAKTGTPLQSTELRGSLPEECPVDRPPHQPSSLESPVSVEYKGEPVSTNAIIQWLRQYVEP
jgi:hypothetical protein